MFVQIMTTQGDTPYSSARKQQGPCFTNMG